MPPISTSAAICAQCSHERQYPFYFTAMCAFHTSQPPRIAVGIPMFWSNEQLKTPSEYWEDSVLQTSRFSPTSSIDVLEESVSVPESSASASISVQPVQDQAVSKRKNTRSREQNRNAQQNFRARKEDLIKARGKRIEVLGEEIATLSYANGRLTKTVECLQQKVAELQQQNKVLRRLSVSNLNLSGEIRRENASVLQDIAGSEVKMASF
jgi:hypothetical protein